MAAVSFEQGLVPLQNLESSAVGVSTFIPLRLGSRANAAIFLILFAVSLAPVIATPIPAMVDYVNHLARMYVIAASGTPEASPFYTVTWAFYPNLAMDLVVPWLARAFGVELAARLFLLASQILIVTGAVAIEFAVKRRFEISGYFALLMLYCAPFAWGFLNFEFALGAALWGVAAWLALRERSWLPRLSVHALFVAALFVSHLFALGLYGFTLGVHELWRVQARRSPPLQLIGAIAVLAAPALTLAVFMAAAGSPVGSPVNAWDFALKPFRIMVAFNGYSAFLSFAEMMILLAMGYALIRQRALRVESSGAWLAAAFALLYLAVPQRMLDTFFVDTRVVVGALLILPAFVTIAFPNRRWRTACSAAMIGMIVASVGLTASVWTSYRADYAAMIASFAKLEKGSRILVAHNGAVLDPPFEDLPSYPMYHAPTLAVHYAQAFVPTLFTTAGKQPVAIKPAFARLSFSDYGPVRLTVLQSVIDGTTAAETPEFVRTWREDFDYLYVIGTAVPNPMPSLLDLMETQARFTLYRIRKPAKS